MNMNACQTEVRVACCQLEGAALSSSLTLKHPVQCVPPGQNLRRRKERERGGVEERGYRANELD